MLFQVKCKYNQEIFTVYDVQEKFSEVFFLIYKDGRFQYERANNYIPFDKK